MTLLALQTFMVQAGIVASNFLALLSKVAPVQGCPECIEACDSQGQAIHQTLSSLALHSGLQGLVNMQGARSVSRLMAVSRATLRQQQRRMSSGFSHEEEVGCCCL